MHRYQKPGGWHGSLTRGWFRGGGPAWVAPSPWAAPHSECRFVPAPAVEKQGPQNVTAAFPSVRSRSLFTTVPCPYAGDRRFPPAMSPESPGSWERSERAGAPATAPLPSRASFLPTD